MEWAYVPNGLVLKLRPELHRVPAGLLVGFAPRLLVCLLPIRIGGRCSADNHANESFLSGGNHQRPIPSEDFPVDQTAPTRRLTHIHTHTHIAEAPMRR